MTRKGVMTTTPALFDDVDALYEAVRDGGATWASLSVSHTLRRDVEKRLGRDASDDEKLACLVAFLMDDHASHRLFRTSRSVDASGPLPRVDVHVDGWMRDASDNPTNVAKDIKAACERDGMTSELYAHGTYRFAAHKIMNGTIPGSLKRTYDFGDGLYLHCPPNAILSATHHALVNRRYVHPVVMVFKLRDEELKAYHHHDLTERGAEWQRLVRAYLRDIVEEYEDHMRTYQIVRGPICLNLKEVQRSEVILPTPRAREGQMIIRSHAGGHFFSKCCERIKIFVLPCRCPAPSATTISPSPPPAKRPRHSTGRKES